MNWNLEDIRHGMWIGKLKEEKITLDYDGNLKRRDERAVPSDLVFGATTVYDSTWETHKVLRNFVKTWMIVSARKPMIVPGPRLKTKYYTKKKYLALARRYIKKFSLNVFVIYRLYDRFKTPPVGREGQR